MQKVLFVCSKNQLRSPTAETVFKNYPNIEVRSAGLDNDARVVLTPDLVQWADIIFVMEKTHKNKLQKKFETYLKQQKLIFLGIPDIYEYMDPELVQKFKAMIPKLLNNY